MSSITYVIQELYVDGGVLYKVVEEQNSLAVIVETTNREVATGILAKLNDER